MSVPSSQRNNGKLEVFVKALDLTYYTLTITKNKKIFLPDYDNDLTKRITDSVFNIYTNLWSANNVLVKTKEDYFERKKLQRQACIDCNNLLCYIAVAKRVFHLSGKRVEYWGRQVIDVRNMARAWISSDTKRYTDIIKT